MMAATMAWWITLTIATRLVCHSYHVFLPFGSVPYHRTEMKSASRDCYDDDGIDALQKVGERC